MPAGSGKTAVLNVTPFLVCARKVLVITPSKMVRSQIYEKLLPESTIGMHTNPFLDTYMMEFLDLPDQYKEADFRKALVNSMKNFILELGKDFTFVGQEYRVQVGNDDFYIDLLFFQKELSCLVAFELKIGKFKPEYISKMDFYLEALDRQNKKRHNKYDSTERGDSMSPIQEILEYKKETEEYQQQIRKMVMDSYKDISAGKGRDCNEFFDELEKRYSHA